MIKLHTLDSCSRTIETWKVSVEEYYFVDTGGFAFIDPKNIRMVVSRKMKGEEGKIGAIVVKLKSGDTIYCANTSENLKLLEDSVK